MIEIGKVNELTFIRKTPLGLVLGSDGHEALLPFTASVDDVELDAPVNAFVYMNSDGRLMATIKTPHACVDEFAVLEMIDQNDDGAFLDLGVEKDVFVPNREQKRPMRKGEKYVVYVYLNEHNSRLEASSRLIDHLSQDEVDFEVGDEVELYIADPGDLGYNAIVNKKFAGLLYHNELYEHLNHGDIRKGYIKKVREENKIDLSLNPIGYTHILDSKEAILAKLEENGGILDLGDKSSPTEVYKRLKISKKAFKKTIGGLYKDRLIEISDFEIKKIAKPDS
ncbi:MAG: RNA-binding protein [Sphingobacteriaceae bacterium]|nr:RNA-binding protein [Sphingobacteriaceae bacterium]